MTPHEFIAKWRSVTLSERSACQQHFLDLCELLGQPKPAAADPEGAWYTFERGVHKQDGGQGWADVWRKDHFGWEYKGRHKNLVAAYNQLLLYREALDNPPLLVVCDLDRFEIHTNFTGTAKKVHAFDLEGLAESKNLDILRKLFTDPGALRPGESTKNITEEAAEQFAAIADGMRKREIPAPDVAHFLMKLMFCMFAEDIQLLPEKVFSKTLISGSRDAKKLKRMLESLFTAMTTGGSFGADEIAWFNGGLFDDAAAFELTPAEINHLSIANGYDWASVEPSIFGTVFERLLDPAKRSQIGAHYTSREDIETLLEPVVMQPLRREWEEVRTKCDQLRAKLKSAAGKTAKGKTTRGTAKAPKERRDHDRALLDFLEHLGHIRILDPACGSGNFLYVAIHLLLELEKQVIAYGATHGTTLLPQVRPTQLLGIEINPYAQQLAQVVIWIGYLQWKHDNAFPVPSHPILEPIQNIRCMDAILDLSDPEHPKEPEWPEADFIVGNPPFLGDKLMRGGLGHGYVEALRKFYEDRIPGQSDLCCYWFERAREALKLKKSKRAGLLATQGIRGGANRIVLDRIKHDGNIFWAISEREWILDGAAVHISMVGFDDGNDAISQLDGNKVGTINSNLTATSNTTIAKVLGAKKMARSLVQQYTVRLISIARRHSIFWQAQMCMDDQIAT